MNLRQWLLRCQRPLLVMLSTVPYVLLMSAAYMPDTPQYWFAAPLIYLLLACVCLLPRGEKRWFCGIAASILQFTLLVSSLPWQGVAWPLLALPVGFTALLLALLPMGGWPLDQELSPIFPLVGLLGYIAAQFLVSRAPARWAMIGTPIICCFLVFLLFTMLMLNRLSLYNAMVDGVHRPPAALKRRNQAVTLGLFVIVLLIGLAPILTQLLDRLWQGILSMISFLVNLLPVSTSSVSSVQQASSDLSGFMGEATEPGLLAVITERIMMIVAGIVMFVGVIFLLRNIIHFAIRLLHYVSEHFKGLAAASSEDYVDETIDTRDGDDDANGSLLNFLSRLHPVRTGPLTPRERIRKLYARLRKKHTAWTDSQTARETLPGAAAELYEKARYSRDEIDNADADGFEQQTRSL